MFDTHYPACCKHSSDAAIKCLLLQLAQSFRATVVMEMSGWWEDQMSMKEEWRYVSTRSGEPFAVGHIGTNGIITDTTGELQMEELSVDNWDIKN